MPQPNDPSTHDDLIVLNINLASLTSGVASLTTILVLQDDVAPGGGRYAEYASSVEVAADVTAGNLDATSQFIADAMFAQPRDHRPEKILFGQVDLSGAESAPTALDAVIAAGAEFYGVVYDSRTVARQIALATDIESKAASGTFLLLGLQNDDADWLTTAIPAAWSATSGYERTVMYYHDDNGADAVSDRLEMAHFANRLSWSPDAKSAGWNSEVASVDLLATGLTTTQKGFARANYANFCAPLGTLAVGQRFVDPGKTLAGRPADHIVSTDWLRTRGSEAVADLIVAASARGEKLTVDAQGQSLIGGAIEAVLEKGVRVGHFSAYRLTALTVTASDITNQRVRFDVEVTLTTGVRTVTINVYSSTTALT